MFPFVLGEAVTRLASFFLVAYITRTLGLEALGIYALGQTISIYVTTIGDFGTRHIGTRLVATTPGALGTIIRAVIHKRLLLTFVATIGGVAYSLLGPVPVEARGFCALMVISTVPTAVNLEWVFLGTSRFSQLGWIRSTGGILLLVLSIGELVLFWQDLRFIALANLLSLIGAAWLGLFLLFRLPSSQQLNTLDLKHQIGWRPVFALGLGTLLTQAFNSIDTLILGALASTSEVGSYSACYKILFLILGIYYLINQSIFPYLAQKGDSQGNRRFVLQLALLSGAVGATIAGVVAVFAKDILTLLYGTETALAYQLLRILLLVLPLDFMVSLFGTALVSWGHYGVILRTTGLAAVLNIVVNLVLIPTLGAKGAAISTIVSYVFLTAAQSIACFLSRTPVEGAYREPSNTQNRNRP